MIKVSNTNNTNKDVSFFVKEPQIRKYKIQGHEMNLKITPDIFPPSEHGSYIGTYAKVNRGENVLDIGTGSGILAILAAKMGGNVTATDISAEAIAAAAYNAHINKVSPAFHIGEYFEGLDDKCFDVIIANPPQEIVCDAYKQKIGEKLSATIDGGEDGNKHIRNILGDARNYMSDMNHKSRMYCAVYTLTDYLSTLRCMSAFFKSNLLDIKSFPVKEHVYHDLDFYKKLNDSGKICMFEKDGTWNANIYYFELTKK